MNADGTERGRRGPLWTSILVGALLGATQLGALDLPRMLAGGHVILDAGEVPGVNTFSWVDPEFAYVNDKWGFMVLVALAERVGGVAGLAGLKLLLGAAAGALLHLLAARTAPGARATGIAALGLAMLSYRLHLRAEWMSVLGVGCVLLLLPGVIESRRRAWIACLALVPVWASMHSYWFLGPALLVWTALWARSAPAFWTGLGMVAAAAVSPHGLDNVLHPLELIGKAGGDVLPEAITELRRPFTSPWTFFHGVALALLALSTVAVAVGFRRRLPAEAAPLALLALAALAADRNLALLGLCAPLAAACLPARALPAIAAGGLLALPALAAPLVGLAPERRAGLGEHEGRFPVELLDEIEPDTADLRFVNDLGTGSYLVLRRGSAFIDGNTEGYPVAFLAAYREMLEGEIGIGEIDSLHPNDGYLLRHRAPPTKVVILGLFLTPDYAPWRWDDVATLFRREPDPEAGDARWRAWMDEVYLERARSWFEPAPALDLPGDLGARLGALRALLDRSPYEPAIYRELAATYERRGAFDQAAKCARYSNRLPPE